MFSGASLFHSLQDVQCDSALVFAKSEEGENGDIKLFLCCLLGVSLWTEV